MEKEFLQRTSRDLLALGSWVFYILVLGRALIEIYRPFVDYMVVGGLVLILLYFIHKDFDDYIARILLVIVFTANFYGDLFFTIFISIVGLFTIAASYYAKTPTKENC